MMDNINICFCSNDKYVKFIPTVINSFIKKNLHNIITIHYIKDFEESDDLIFLRNFVSKFDNLHLKEYYKTWDFQYKGFSHIESSASMIRLFIPDIIKEKKVLYLDLDLIINLDLSEIYKLDCGETGIRLRNHNNVLRKRWWPRYMWKEIMSLPREKRKSGNSGVMLLDLEKLRKNNFIEKCLKLHAKHPGGSDQYIINLYTITKQELLEPRFNIFADEGHLIDENENFIFHWCGGYKPWINKNKKYDYLWDDFKVDVNE